MHRFRKRFENLNFFRLEIELCLTDRSMMEAGIEARMPNTGRVWKTCRFGT